MDPWAKSRVPPARGNRADILLESAVVGSLTRLPRSDFRTRQRQSDLRTSSTAPRYRRRRSKWLPWPTPFVLLLLKQMLGPVRFALWRSNWIPRR